MVNDLIQKMQAKIIEVRNKAQRIIIAELFTTCSTSINTFVVFYGEPNTSLD